MRKIAILKYRDVYLEGGDSETIIKSITDWDDVDDETFLLLQKAASRSRGSTGEIFAVIERIALSDFIGTTVKDYLELAKKEKERMEESARKRAEKKAEREIKKKLKQEQSEKEQFELLKKKFESDKE